MALHDEKEKTVLEFLSSVSDGTPTPGGGSVSAFAGALGSALVEMVANLTLAKEGLEDRRETMLRIRDGVRACCRDLMAAVSEDSMAYEKVMVAYRLPRGNEEEKERRSARIQEMLKRAAEIPLGTAHACVKILELCLQVVKEGSPSAVTDGGVAALLAHAAMEGAVLNVRVNLSGLRDKAFAEEMEGRAKALSQRGGELREQILAIVNKGISST